METERLSIHQDVGHETYRVSQEVEEDYPDNVSELSEDSTGSVEDSVAEEMEKLEQSFKGISARFRLVNRIGEGMLSD